MATNRGSDVSTETAEHEIEAFMRVWGVDEDVARGMIAIEKLDAQKPTPTDDKVALDASTRRLYRDIGTSKL